jgi:ubiquinone/menaquinone biosynthesis C-methylase UbiE
VSEPAVPKISSSEFTGERVIPGQVNDDLWAEHLSRYAFAARFAAHGRTLDLGCGTGYGAAEFSAASRLVVGIDASHQAITYARQHFSAANTTFVPASAIALPFRAEVFDLITAFEVIEHLPDWRTLLAEARRVLAPGGLFFVSTPNKLYYTESRGADGPNPFHEHEFEYEEFRAALQEFFPHVAMHQQNRLEAVAFYPETPLPMDARIDRSQGNPEEANFFLAVCSVEQPAPASSFLYVPRAANLLKEREQHIKLLQADLDRLIAEHQDLATKHSALTNHLEEQNRWAQELEHLWKDTQERVMELQEEFRIEQQKAVEVVAGYNRKVADLENENRDKTKWALDTERRLNAELITAAGQLADTLSLLDRAENTVVERTHWAQQLDERVRQLEARITLIGHSRWVKMGRTVGLGPKVEP